MPSRILREGILTSDRVDTLDERCEVFYRRLMSVVDDFGRYDARPQLLRVACYPLRVDRIREADISRWLDRLQTAGLILLYEVNGKHYLEMLDFKQQIRAKDSKWPTPASGTPCKCVADAKQPLADVHLDVDVDGVEAVDVVGVGDEVEAHPRAKNRRAVAKNANGADRGFDEFWAAYPKRVAKDRARKAWEKLKPDLALQSRIIAALARAKVSDAWTREDGRYVPHPATWLSGRRWEDEDPVRSRAHDQVPYGAGEVL